MNEPLLYQSFPLRRWFSPLYTGPRTNLDLSSVSACGLHAGMSLESSVVLSLATGGQELGETALVNTGPKIPSE